jgi:photosystem II stability/assembly factor-like uncharacterized protein
MPRTKLGFAAALLLSLGAVTPLPAQLPSGLLSELHWRNIGPMRGGRTRSAAGVPGTPYVFYVGVVNGGVWKSTDAGRTWLPIFDDQPTQSIGSLVVAPSDPNVLYVGSGEGLQRPDLSVGDGLYKSTDAGKTWAHLGLRDAQQIPNIAVDPTNPNRLFVAALGHPYGPSTERGIFRSTDGGQTFTPVLFRDENTGGNDVDIDPTDPNTVYANLWEARQGPWENAAWLAAGENTGIFKSIDGGTNWKHLTNGLPEGTNQVNLAIAPSNPKRLYATVASQKADTQRVGIYASDDAGETWTQITRDNRPAGRIGGGDLPVPIVNPKDADVLVMVSTVSWKSTDGGRTWAPFKGAPGGEDYQGGWISPTDPNTVLLVADQGASITLNGGETWSSWYNQPTAQLYHVAADNAFPYRLCSGQQENGSACVASRGNYGAISDRDWLPAGGDEYGYLAPDPRDPDIVFGGRSVARFDRRTGQVSTVGPVGGGRGGAALGPPGAYRQVRTQPVVFSQADPRALFFGNNFLWRTTDGGLRWKQMSPDLTRTTYDLPKSIGKYADTSLVTQRGVIYTIAPSPLDTSRIWVGTDDGLIQLTADGGKTWRDVTPKAMGPWWKVFMIDAGHFDRVTAYAAVNTLRLDDMHPHIFRTHDGGRTWTEIVTGMDGAGPANAVREDPKKKGLLYASTETGVWFSLDDGDHWQSLRLNLPASSVRDLIVKDDDIAVATHGRGFWILDDITPLRQLSARTLEQDAVLFQAAPAWRVRWNTSIDMPWPKEEATTENPPEGAAISYYLKADASAPVTLEIVDAAGRLVRWYSSTDTLAAIPDNATSPVPTYWYRAPHGLSAAAGLHRFMWDVHYQPLPGGGRGGRGGLPISAIPHNSASGPTTPWVSPGTYTVKLTVNGKTYSQPISVKQDPRVKTSPAAMQEVYTLTDATYKDIVDAQAALVQLASLREQVATIKPQTTGALAGQLARLDDRAAMLQALINPPEPVNGRGGRGGGGRGGRGGGAPAAPDTSVLTALAGVTNLLQAADVPATANQRAAMQAAKARAQGVMTRWTALKTTELSAVNARLTAAKQATIKLAR